MEVYMVTDGIFKTIDVAIDKRVGYLKDMDMAGIIVDIPDKDDAYTVKISNQNYKVPNGSGLGFKEGDTVWIHSPNGDFNSKYIIAKKVSSANLSRNSGTGQTGEGGSISSDDIITDEEIDAMFA